VEFLDELHRAEIGPIVAVQEALGWLRPLLWLASLLGADVTVLLLLSAAYWCVNPRLVFRVTLVVLLSAGVNAVAKLVFYQPRPYWIDARVLPLSGETSFGLPSGHAQTSVVAGGVFAWSLRSARVAWVALGCVAVISLSRVYLGVHFISDVVAGWALGLVILLLVTRLSAPLTAWWRRRSLASQLLLSALIAGTLLGAGVAATVAHEGWVLPPGWRVTSAADPASLERVTAMSGALFGALAGLAGLDRLGWVSADGPVSTRILRWLLGMVVALGIWFATAPLGDSIVVEAARYALVAAWVVLGAPLAFVRLGLATAEQAPPVAGRRQA
jgi:membrane-associated phospholipid phosphatase